MRVFTENSKVPESVKLQTAKFDSGNWLWKGIVNSMQIVADENLTVWY